MLNSSKKGPSKSLQVAGDNSIARSLRKQRNLASHPTTFVESSHNQHLFVKKNGKIIGVVKGGVPRGGFPNFP